jgi:hypothetical protein
MESLFLVTAVVGAVEFLRRCKISDWFAAITIVVSAVIGMVYGGLDGPGVANMWEGLVIGLSASGLVTVASRPGTAPATSARVLDK